MDTKRILKKTGINDNTLGWAHAYIKRFPNKETTKNTTTKNDSPILPINSLESKLAKKLKSKVKIKFKNNSGSIIIHYNSLKILKNLVRQIIDK